MVNLNPDQKNAHDDIVEFFRSKGGMLRTLGGYAGTGKTSIIAHIANSLRDKRIAFCAPSGKAALMMKSKLKGVLKEKDFCGTIHKLIYFLVGIKSHKELPPELIFEKHEKELPYDLIILDEASMVRGDVYHDLKQEGIPILAVGDHGQLPPVKGDFNLMENPDIKLETIMRQAEGDPIVKVATLARETGHIPYGDYGPNVKKVTSGSFLNKHNFKDLNSIVLCAKNKTRVNLNRFAREVAGYAQEPFEDTPCIGEPVICLMNNYRMKIFNGDIGVIRDLRDFETDVYQTEIEMSDHYYKGDIYANQFGQLYTNSSGFQTEYALFDWAYCITVHKSQGSEWDHVTLMEERMSRMDDDQWRRWLYTGVTRAKKSLTIIKR